MTSKKVNKEMKKVMKKKNQFLTPTLLVTETKCSGSLFRQVIALFIAVPFKVLVHVLLL